MTVVEIDELQALQGFGSEPEGWIDGCDSSEQAIDDRAIMDQRQEYEFELGLPARGGRGSLGEQRKDEVFDGHVLVLQALGLALGGVEQPGQSLGQEHLARRSPRTGNAWTPGQLTLQLGLQTAGVGADLRHQPRHEPVRLIEEGEEEMFPVDLGVAEPQRLGLSVVQCLLRLLGEPVHVHGRPPRGRAVSGGGRRCAASMRPMRSRRSTTSPSAA